MSTIRLNLLGDYQIHSPAGALVTLSAKKSQALLAFLAVKPTQLVSRDKMALLLWSGSGPEQARQSRIPPRVPLVLIDAVSSGGVPFATGAIRQLRAQQRPEINAESLAYKKWLDTIPGARLIVTDHSGHNIPIEQPELVVETVRQVVRQATDGQTSAR